MRVIYVDDERSAHINFAYNIEKQIDITLAEYFKNCKSAIEYVETHEVDCAFLDIDLPDGNGINLAKKLKKI